MARKRPHSVHTEAKLKRREKKTKPGDPAAVFITKSEIAMHLGGASMNTIHRSIAAGDFPPPHSRPGRRFPIWLRKHWQAYVDTGRWPREAFPGYLR
jgi:hypothetical protein